MIQASADELDRISGIHGHKVILVGEMHGSKQNAPLMQGLLSLLLKPSAQIAMAFEWMLAPSEQDALRAYVRGGRVPDVLPDFFLHSDGRFTSEHVKLLGWVRGYNAAHDDAIDILFFDERPGRLDQEKGLADALTAYLEQHPDRILLVETGNRHAQKNTKGARRSMATLLQDRYDIFSIFIRYLSGTINVEGSPRDVTMAASQRRNPEPYFDMIIELPASQASDVPTDLKMIKSMFSI